MNEITITKTWAIGPRPTCYRYPIYEVTCPGEYPSTGPIGLMRTLAAKWAEKHSLTVVDKSRD